MTMRIFEKCERGARRSIEVAVIACCLALGLAACWPMGKGDTIGFGPCWASASEEHPGGTIPFLNPAELEAKRARQLAHDVAVSGTLAPYVRAQYELPWSEEDMDPALMRRLTDAESALIHWPPREISREDAAAFNRFLHKARRAFDLVREGLRQDKPGWPPIPSAGEWDDTGGVECSIRLRNLGWVLVARGVLAQSEGRISYALHCHLDTIEFATDLARGGRMIELLQSLSVRGELPRPMLELLAADKLSRASLRSAVLRLTRVLGEQEPFSAFVEREFRSQDAILRTPEDVPAPLRSGTASAAKTWSELSGYRADILSAAEMGYPEWLEANIDRHWEALSPLAEEVGALQPSLWRTVRSRYERFESLLRAATLVAALELYRIDRGCYPAALRQLTPSYLKDLPDDPFSGAPFIYSSTGAAWTMYSVGPDAKDNAGAGDDILFRSHAGLVSRAESGGSPVPAP